MTVRRLFATVSRVAEARIRNIGRRAALRAALIGAAAGFVAMVAGGVAGWGVTTFVMEGSFRLAPGAALAVVAGGAGLSLLAGLGFALRPLAARPARTLRARA